MEVLHQSSAGVGINSAALQIRVACDTLAMYLALCICHYSLQAWPPVLAYMINTKKNVQGEWL